MRGVVEAGHAWRKEQNLKVRTPLREIIMELPGNYSNVPLEVWTIALEELNIKNLIINSKLRFPQNEIKVTDDELKAEGEARDIVRLIQEERKKQSLKPTDAVDVVLPTWPTAFENDIKRKALIKNLSKGDTLVVMKTS